MTVVGGMKDFVALLEERGKCGLAHLKPTFSLALAFVVGCGEHACLQYDLLVIIVFNPRSGEREEVLIVNHPGVLVSEGLGPVNSTAGYGMGFKFY